MISYNKKSKELRTILYFNQYNFYKPIYVNIRSKRKVFDDLLHGGQPILYVRWLLTSFRGSHACSFFSCSTAEMSSSFYDDFIFLS